MAAWSPAGVPLTGLDDAESLGSASALLWILSVELLGWKPSGSLQPTLMSTGERKRIPGICLDVEQPLACVGVQGDEIHKEANKNLQ